MNEQELVNALYALLVEARRAERTPIVRAIEQNLEALHSVITLDPTRLLDLQKFLQK
jgi:hypothetical protein